MPAAAIHPYCDQTDISAERAFSMAQSCFRDRAKWLLALTTSGSRSNPLHAGIIRKQSLTRQADLSLV
jgi:hypothetical protein